ncbi:MAG: tail fiber domain-containing protein [Opitutaceae bacterium]|nr:tail fiber domain-containing protein [Cytophagales bacterium]
MRRVHLILPFLVIAFFVSVKLQAQAPPKFNYQAVARDATTKLFIINKKIGVKIEILNLTTNAIVYTEEQTANTNDYGLFSLSIGGGAGFSVIDWGTAAYSISISVDPLGGTTYARIGSAQLLSVPYALYANKSGNQISSNTKKSYQGGKGITVDTLVLNTIKISSSLDTNFVRVRTLPKKGEIIYYDGVSWNVIPYTNTSNQVLTSDKATGVPVWAGLDPDIIRIVKSTASDGQVIKFDSISNSWKASTDATGGPGQGISKINSLHDVSHNFSLDTTANIGFTHNSVALTSEHVIGIPTIGKAGVTKGVLSLADYTTFKNATIGNSITVGAGLAKSGNNIRLNINGTLDTIGGILKVRTSRFDSLQTSVSPSTETYVIKVVGGKLQLAPDDTSGTTGNGITKLNGQNAGYQTIKLDTTAKDFNLTYSSSNPGTIDQHLGLPTLNNNSNVDRGLISKSDYDFFKSGNSKSYWDTVTGGINYQKGFVTIGVVTSTKKAFLVTGEAEMDALTVGGNATISELADVRYLKFRGPNSDYIKRQHIGSVLTSVDTMGNVGWALPGNSSGWGLKGNDITADPNYFIGTTTNHALTLKAFNTTGLVIDPTTGFVGIGDWKSTEKPINSLTVKGGLNIDFDEKSTEFAMKLQNGPYLLFGNATSGEGITSQQDYSTTGNANINGLDFFTNNITALAIGHNGHVGIGGISNPSHYFHVGPNFNNGGPDQNTKYNVRFEAYGKKGNRALYVDNQGVVRDTNLVRIVNRIGRNPVDSVIGLSNGDFGKVLKWDGLKWTPSTDNIGGSGSALSVKVDKITIDTTILGVLVVKASSLDSTKITKRKLALIGLAGDGALNNEVLTYDATSSSWKPKALGSSGALLQGSDIRISGGRINLDRILDSTYILNIPTGKNFRVDGLGSQNLLIDSANTSINLGVGVVNPLSRVHTSGYFRSDSLKSNDGYPRLLIARSNGIIDTLNSKKGVLASDDLGNISWVPGASQAWSLGGNNISATDYFGTIKGNTNSLKIATDGTPRMFIDNVGKVGIGTGVSDRAFLEQQGSTSGVAAIFGGEAAGVSLLSSTSGIGFNQYINSFVKSISPGFGGFIAVDNANSGEMWFGTSSKATMADETVASSIKMILSQTGSLGIGLKPLSKLHVNGNIRLDSLRGLDTSSVAVTPTGLLIRTKGSGWGLSGNNIIPGQFIGTTSPSDSFIIKTNNQTRIAISPNSTNVGIGGLPLTTATLAVYGNLVSGSISNPSDIRYKKNVAKIDGALQKVSKLNGVSYNWKREDFAQMNFMEGKDFGLIAQEVELTFPELVLTDERGFKSVRYTQLIPFLLEAIKEQQKQIENLSNEVHLKDANLKVVENKINSLETSISTMNSQMQLLLKSIGNPPEVVSSK